MSCIAHSQTSHYILPVPTVESHSYEMYSIQHYRIMFAGDLRQVSTINKTDRHNMTEILCESGVHHNLYQIATVSIKGHLV